MSSHFYQFLNRNKWNLLLALSVIIFISLAYYSIEEDKKDTTATMEYKTKLEAEHISMNLSTELDKVTNDLLSIYDVKISSPPQNQYEFWLKTNPLLEKSTFLSSISYIDTEKNLNYIVPIGTDLSTSYQDSNSILEIAMLVAGHTKKPYLTRPYEITPDNY